VRRGASAAERCGSALWPNVLSVVRKSRNSSGGLYRCRRRSAHDRRRTNAVRFLMNTLLVTPNTELDSCISSKPSLGTLGSHRCLRVPAKPLSRDPRLPAWHNYSSQSFGASSILLFKVAGCWQAQKIRIQNRCLPRLRLIAHGTFPRRSSTSGVGFVQPSSRSPRSPHLKSHSRQRRPTRLKVM
jgi:hypothetical protein